MKWIDRIANVAERGATKRLSAVKWGVTINLFWAWVLTIPVSGLLAAWVYVIIKFGSLVAGITI